MYKMFYLLFFLGGKAGGDGLKLSEDTKRPLGGKAGGGRFELESEPSSIDKRLSVEADLLDCTCFFFSLQSTALIFSTLAFSISF